MAVGQSFRNGVDGLHAKGVNWGEPLTIVRRDHDAHSYGVVRYLVKDKYGRHSFAY